jgi:hypothetical protein
MHHRSRSLHCLGAAALALSFAPAHAERPASLDRVSVWLGGYDMHVGADASVDDPAHGISLQDQDILHGDKTVARARIDWLLFDRQGFSVDYYTLRQKDSRGIQNAFTANGTTYDVGGAIGYDTRLDVGNVSYRFWLGEDNNLFGIGLGAQYYSIKAKLTAKVDAASAGSFDAVTEESASGWAPLLTLGWRTRINDAWRLYADASGARYDNGKQHGSIVNAAVGVEYFPWQNVGVGAEYGVARVRYKRVEDDYTARLNVNFDGPAVFLRLRF